MTEAEERRFWEEVAEYLKKSAPFDVFDGAFVKVTDQPGGSALKLQLAVRMDSEESNEDIQALYIRDDERISGRIHAGYGNGASAEELPMIDVDEDVSARDAASLIVRQLADTGNVYVPAEILN